MTLARYRLVRRETARRWHLESIDDAYRALCGVAWGPSPVARRYTSDLRLLTCPDCLAIVTGKASSR